MQPNLFEAYYARLEANFRPSKPIDEQRMLAGRTRELTDVDEAIRTGGLHAVLYGNRGVGKTSLANVAADRLRERHEGEP